MLPANGPLAALMSAFHRYTVISKELLIAAKNTTETSSIISVDMQAAPSN